MKIATPQSLVHNETQSWIDGHDFGCYFSHGEYLTFFSSKSQCQIVQLLCSMKISWNIMRPNMTIGFIV